MLATRAVGVDAIRLLDGRSIQEVQGIMQARTGTSRMPALHALMQALANANMIRSIDGVRVSRREVTTATFFRFVYLYYVAPRLRSTAQAMLPLSWIPCVIFWINYIGNRQRISAQLKTGNANLARIFHDLSERRVRRMQREHRRYLTYTKLDPESLVQRTPQEIDRWLEQHMYCVGANHLRPSGPGGIVVGVPHMNRFGLVPLLLMKTGFRVCLIGTTSVGMGLQQRFDWYAQFMELPGYGRFTLLPNFSLQNIRRAVQLLQEGYLLISHPDAALAPFLDETIQARMHFFRMDYSGLPPATVRVTLRGHELSGGLLLFWLAAYARSSFVSAVCLPCGPRSELRIAPPVNLLEQLSTTAEQARVFAREFYAHWAEQLSSYPAQWFGWHLLHKWNLSPQKVQTQKMQREEEAIPFLNN